MIPRACARMLGITKVRGVPSRSPGGAWIGRGAPTDAAVRSCRLVLAKALFGVIPGVLFDESYENESQSPSCAFMHWFLRARERVGCGATG